MTKLSDTQAVILASASHEERTIDSIQPSDASLNRVWRQDDDGRSILLYITKAGLAAIGCEPEDAEAPDADAEPEAVPYGMLEGTNSAGKPAAGATDEAKDAPKAEGERKGGSRKKGTGPRRRRRARPGATARSRTSPRC